ncbi:hypothetical protein L3X38_018584 [Prunus dulcis]|uniref:Uncharacterized protein n=1 Tax=Prunus dulcis TaxID=3755 RepID=A0AAD4WBJ1_PRUDU|nr:hypothetical protein L3X38_018584 [Prunus dulcis]
MDKINVTPRTGSAVTRYCPLWAWLHSHQPARFCSWELTEQLPRVVTHPGIAPASHSLNFGVPSTPKPVSSQKASYRFRVAQRTGPNSTYYDIVRFGTHDWALTGLFLGRTTFSCAPKRPRVRWMRASHSLNFGVPSTPKPVSSQKASYRFRVAQRTGPNSTYYDIVRFGTHDWALTGLFLGRTTFSCAPKRPRAVVAMVNAAKHTLHKVTNKRKEMIALLPSTQSRGGGEKKAKGTSVF